MVLLGMHPNPSAPNVGLLEGNGICLYAGLIWGPGGRPQKTEPSSKTPISYNGNMIIDYVLLHGIAVVSVYQVLFIMLIPACCSCARWSITIHITSTRFDFPSLFLLFFASPLPLFISHPSPAPSLSPSLHHTLPSSPLLFSSQAHTSFCSQFPFALFHWVQFNLIQIALLVPLKYKDCKSHYKRVQYTLCKKYLRKEYASKWNQYTPQKALPAMKKKYVKLLLSAPQTYSKFRADNALAHNQLHSSYCSCALPGSGSSLSPPKPVISDYFKDLGMWELDLLPLEFFLQSCLGLAMDLYLCPLQITFQRGARQAWMVEWGKQDIFVTILDLRWEQIAEPFLQDSPAASSLTLAPYNLFIPEGMSTRALTLA